MAKKTKKTKTVDQNASGSSFDEGALTKGELRKLNALRKSVGDKLGEDTFAKWLQKRQSKQPNDVEDKNANLIADALVGLIDQKGLRIPRGGYLVTRGRGRVIVELPAGQDA